MTGQRTAWVYACKDNSRSSDEGQFFAEVVSDPGEETEEVLYTTTWYTAPHPAWNDAEKWMADNGVEVAPE